MEVRSYQDARAEIENKRLRNIGMVSWKHNVAIGKMHDVYHRRMLRVETGYQRALKALEDLFAVESPPRFRRRGL